MRKEDRVRVKAQIDKIKDKPVPARDKDETNYCIRKQYIIAEEEVTT